jgi:hypothetical protein
MDGYSLLNNYTCNYSEVSTSVKKMSTATKVISGIGAILAVAISILNLSSPMAIWAIANQFQLFALLLLTKTNLPADVRGYISNDKLLSFSFDFLSIDKLFFVKFLTNWMDKDQLNDELEEIGIISGNTFNNNVNLIFIFLVIAFVHVLILFLPRKLPEHEVGPIRS